MPERDRKFIIYADDFDIRRAGHCKDILINVIGLFGVIITSVNRPGRVTGSIGNLAGVLVVEFQVLSTEDNARNLEFGIHRYVQALQFAVSDGQAGGGSVPEGNAQAVHAPHGHVSGATEGKGLIGPGVREFQILGTKGNGTHVKFSVDGQVEALENAFGNHQSWR